MILKLQKENWIMRPSILMNLKVIQIKKSISWQYMHVLIDILKDRKSSTVKGFLLRHSDEIKKGWNGYVHAVQKCSLLLSFWCRYCGRQVSCHKAGELDDKKCEDKIIQFRNKVQGIQEILETNSKNRLYSKFHMVFHAVLT